MVGAGTGARSASEPGSPSRADHEARARETALRLLGYRTRSRAELAAALAGKGVPEDIAESVLDRYTEVGLINDTALADTLVRDRHTQRGDVGPALAADLRKRGVSDATAAEALAQITPEDEASRALALARRKLATTATLPPETRRRRTHDYLARRGYSPSAAHRAITQALAEEGDSTDQ